MSTYLAIGSICWDEVPVGHGLERRLGGSVLFAARVARAAGWTPVVVTSGTEALAVAARAELPGVEVVVQPSPTDTVMAFGRRTDLGPQRVPTVADPIDLHRALGDVDVDDADIVHLAPIMGEVTRSLVDRLPVDALVGITPQGLLRGRDGAGRLHLVDRPVPWWMDAVDVVVASEDEHRRLAEGLGAGDTAVAVTRGERGCWGWRGSEQVDLAGIEVVPSPAGTIGAGDVFAASLFLALADGLGFPEAMERANATAARHVAGQPSTR